MNKRNILSYCTLTVLCTRVTWLGLESQICLLSTQLDIINEDLHLDISDLWLHLDSSPLNWTDREKGCLKLQRERRLLHSETESMSAVLQREGLIGGAASFERPNGYEIQETRWPAILKNWMGCEVWVMERAASMENKKEHWMFEWKLRLWTSGMKGGLDERGFNMKTFIVGMIGKR